VARAANHRSVRSLASSPRSLSRHSRIRGSRSRGQTSCHRRVLGRSGCR
jgi:hypothetical protein